MAITAKDLKEVASSLNILYAEDEEILREGMQSSLSKLFANVYTARNGQEAFEYFKKEDIDIVMTDINMPIMSGVELIESINRYTDKEPKIIVLSAHNESKLLQNIINMGVNNYLNKPVDKQVMVSLLYKAAQAITDGKLLIEYRSRLEKELEFSDRKNKILEEKLKQLAVHVNKAEAVENKESVVEVKKVDDNYFDTLLQDDKDELRDLSHELESFIAMLFTDDGLNEDYIDILSVTYKNYASVLNAYVEFFDVAVSLTEFSNTILSLRNKFMENLQQTGIYFESLQLTLESFRHNVWEKEAQNPRFYNASLKMDIQLIIDFLEEKEIVENEIEFF
ncbi:MAG: YesN/AraC family two-component response regulator [Sulfurimonas sp.]|jgi:YesN/AraC family two-component response regulator|uniref:response regulator transcription factor n=1 Tax=Sulfurimonas sp. TaxID=2022749 RepID=UPI0039E2D318